MRLSFLVGVAFVGLGIASCQKTAPDGLSLAGHIRPLSTGFMGPLTRADLTDASAYLTALQRIVAKAAPVDSSNPASEKDWTRFYEAEKAKIGKPSDSFILPITCNADKSGVLTPVSYDATSKNVTIRIYTGESDQDDKAEAARKLISFYRRYEMTRIESELLGVGDVADDYALENKSNSITSDLQDVAETAGSLKLPSGTIIADDSPIGGAATTLSLTLAKVGLATEIARSAILRERRQISYSSILTPLEKEGERWRFYPDSQLPEPFWRRAVPFAGSEKELCLLGQFGSLDLTHRADSIIPLINPKASLFGNLHKWYLVDKLSLHIVAEASAPT